MYKYIVPSVPNVPIMPYKRSERANNGSTLFIDNTSYFCVLFLYMRAIHGRSYYVFSILQFDCKIHNKDTLCMCNLHYDNKKK